MIPHEEIALAIGDAALAAFKEVVTQFTKNYLDETMTITQYREAVGRALQKMYTLHADQA